MKGDREYGEYKDLCVNIVMLKEVQTRKTMNSHKQIEGKTQKEDLFTTVTYISKFLPQ